MCELFDCVHYVGLVCLVCAQHGSDFASFCGKVVALLHLRRKAFKKSSVMQERSKQSEEHLLLACFTSKVLGNVKCVVFTCGFRGAHCLEEPDRNEEVSALWESEWESMSTTLQVHTMQSE